MIQDAPPVLRDLFFGPAPIAWVQDAIGPGWAPFFRVVTVPGISWGVIIAVGLALWLWGRKVAYSVLGIVVLQALVSSLMNQIFFLPRPSADSIIRYEQLEIGSFPSGHVFRAAAVWGWLYAAGRIPLWLAALIVGMVGVSRIYLGVHFVGDVVGGLLIAVALVWAYGRGWPSAWDWLAERGRIFLAGLAGATVLAAAAAVTLVEPDNPYAWNAVGVMLAAPLALGVEWRWGADQRPEGSRLLGIVLGMAGVLPLLALWLGLPPEATVPAAATTAAGTLWAWAAAPLLLHRLRDR